MTWVQYQGVLQACVHFGVRPEEHPYVLRHKLWIIPLPPRRHVRCGDLTVNGERILRLSPFEQSDFQVDWVPLRTPRNQTMNINLFQDPRR